ncbi:Bug family tripartite tricarboxylate transporter substrate binding protein [Piscinibacter sakaiensis]|uniref:Bug family tripartite tricarboxylate transporter substrate binding protein n=1 Tax=Piscinibacter sakaiensis TaxID=1547922 RepID=UPI003AB091DF
MNISISISIKKAGALLALALAAHGGAWAQADRMLKFVVPFPAGGGGDRIARTMQPALEAELQQTVIIENKSGAGGFIGTAHVARAAPDSNTVVFGIGSTFGTAPAYFEHLPYDVRADFTPITLIGTQPLMLTVRADLPARNLQELIKLAKSKPGGLTFASLGDGSAHRLAAELLQLETQTKMLHVPYKGTGPALIDIAGGTVDMMFVDYSSSAPLVQAKKLRILGAAGPQRVPTLPDVPTLSEQGVPVDALAWFAVYAPKGLPAAEMARLNRAFVKAIRSEEFQKRFAELGGTPDGSSPEQLKTFAESQVVKWAQVMQRAGIARDKTNF